MPRKNSNQKTLQIPYDLYDITCFLFNIVEDYLRHDRTHAECREILAKISWLLGSTKRPIRITLDEELDKLRSYETTRKELKEAIATATGCTFAIALANEARQRDWDLDRQTRRFINYLKDAPTPWNVGITLVVFQEMEDRMKNQKAIFDEEQSKKKDQA